jgi:hypothetical protein
MPNGRSRPQRHNEVTSVTTAAAGRSDDLRSRTRRYLLMMSIRFVCLPLAVITQGWLRWLFILGAVVLPYIAVVIANAASRPAPGVITHLGGRSPHALPPGANGSDQLDM